MDICNGNKNLTQSNISKPFQIQFFFKMDWIYKLCKTEVELNTILKLEEIISININNVLTKYWVPNYKSLFFTMPFFKLQSNN